MENPLLAKLEELEQAAKSELEGISDSQTVSAFKVKYLGKKGEITSILKGMGGLDPAERPKVGGKVNLVKAALEELIAQKAESLEGADLKSAMLREKIDLSLPGVVTESGNLHPVTQVMAEIDQVFSSLGFESHTGPNIETDYYNFEALNIPADHPAKDMQDTFYLEDPKYLLRTHTSPVQIRVMESTKPPIRMIAPGAVYRCDSDISHTPMFHQVEGLWVEEGIRFSDLKGVLTIFIQETFGKDVPVRFRPSFFPFTEPSAEVDMGCVLCKNTGCRVCSDTGWIEIMGCGMVDPAVLGHVQYDAEKFTGFAFGMGVERIAMLKLGIKDIRLLFENDLRFLRQF